MREKKDDTQRKEKLVQFMDRLGNLGYFNGSVLVAKGEDIWLKKGYGFANFEHGVYNQPHTKFRIGSITKGFTAAAILQLEEKGELKVSDTIDRFIEDYPNGKKITIHHLLTHTSGIPNHTVTEEFWDTTMRLYAPSVNYTIDLFKHLPLVAELGEKFHYSNGNYLLLSAIIEKVSGLSYGDYVEQYLLNPLSMKATGYTNGRNVVPHLSSGYTVWEDVVFPEYEDMSASFGAYGLYSTVEDLFTWHLALNEETILTKESLSNMFTAHQPIYGGYGWHVTNDQLGGEMRRRISHLGDTTGTISHFARYPDEDVVIILLSNVSLTAIPFIHDQAARIMFGEEVDIPFSNDRPFKLDVDALRLEGTYAVENEGESFNIFITKEKGACFVTMPKAYGVFYKYELIPIGAEDDMVSFRTAFIPEKVSSKYDTLSKKVMVLIHEDAYGNRITAEKISEDNTVSIPYPLHFK
ncbi:CubicO group peptidase (beta-lactamase class C family) [Bacillus fengqiuensis]|nr:CubicO group peptidase (beta-lactamase class C family) [Bacillus fengqiuensis]